MCGTGECTSKQLWTFTLSLTWFSTLILTRASSRGRLLPSLTVDPHVFQVTEMGVKGGALRSRVWWHHLGWSLTLWVCDKTAACQWPWSRKPRGSSAHQEPLYGKTRWTRKLACNPVPVKFTRYRTIPQVWDLILIHYQFIPLMNTVFRGTSNTKGHDIYYIHGSQRMNPDVSSYWPPDLPARVSSCTQEMSISIWSPFLTWNM